MQSAAKARSSRAQSLSDAIEHDIVTGVFKAGVRLDEVRLAERYGVSRTPIREAFMQLASAGLVEIRPYRGAFVVEIGAAELIEMFEVMAELEGMCGRLAARRVTPERLAALLTAHKRCLEAEQSGDADAYYYANQVFHHELYRSSNNSFLERQATSLHRRLRPYRRLQLRVPGRVGTSRQEHQAIVDAIAAGDSDAAEAALKEHILIQGSRFSDFIEALQEAPVTTEPQMTHTSAVNRP